LINCIISSVDCCQQDEKVERYQQVRKAATQSAVDANFGVMHKIFKAIEAIMSSLFVW